MGIVIRQSFWNSINSYLGVGLGAFNTMILFPRLYPENPGFVGEVQTLLAFAVVTSTFGHFGMPATILSYFPRFNKQQQSQLYSLGLILCFSGAILIFSGALIYQWWFSVDLPIVIGSLVAVGMIFFELFASISQYFSKLIVPGFIKNVFRRIIITTALLLVYFLELHNSFVYTVLLLGYLLQVVMIILYTRASLPGFSLVLSAIKTQKLFLYGTVIMLSAGAGIAVSRLDILMLNLYLGNAEVAFYSIAFFIGAVVSIPAKSLLYSLHPLVAKSWAQGNFKEVEQLYKKSAINHLFINGFIFLLIWTNINLIYDFLPEEYRFGQWVVFFIAMGEVVKSATGINGMIINISNKQRYNFYAGTGLVLLTVFTNAIFIPLLGLTGAALASFLSLAIFDFFKFLMVKKWYKFSPFTKQYQYIALVLFLVTLILVFKYYYSLNSFLFQIAFNLALIFVFYLTFKFSSELKELHHLHAKFLKFLKR